MQGEDTRDALERERVRLMDINDSFEQIEFDHQTLIYESQSALINLSKDLNKTIKNVEKKLKVYSIVIN